MASACTDCGTVLNMLEINRSPCHCNDVKPRCDKCQLAHLHASHKHTSLPYLTTNTCQFCGSTLFTNNLAQFSACWCILYENLPTLKKIKH